MKIGYPYNHLTNIRKLIVNFTIICRIDDSHYLMVQHYNGSDMSKLRQYNITQLYENKACWFKFHTTVYDKTFEHKKF